MYQQDHALLAYQYTNEKFHSFFDLNQQSRYLNRKEPFTDFQART